MSLPRTLEPEVMDTAEEALDYDSMDHGPVNRQFVDDLLGTQHVSGDILDLGTGTAQIPVELARRWDDGRILAADLSIAMLELARYNIEIAGMNDRIQLAHADAKRLPFPDRMFSVVISNAMVHHLPEPRLLLAEAVRVLATPGLVFIRDLLRPDDEATLETLVDTYAVGANDHQRAMFAASFHAALRLDEVQALVQELGGNPNDVCQTSDRHWTWNWWRE